MYLDFCLFCGIPWIVLFAVRPDLRRRMLIFSSLMAPLGLVSEIWFLQDYWKRETVTGTAFGIEDAISTFFLSGTAFAVFKVVHNKQILKMPGEQKTGVEILLIAGVCYGLLILFSTILKYNSVIVSAVIFWLAFLFFVRNRKDLIVPGLLSGIYMLALSLAVYTVMLAVHPDFIEAWCLDCNPTGLMIGRANIEELFWDFSWGLVVGVFFDYARGYKLTDRRP